MELFVISFVAGILTVAAPCILPLLPVIIGGSIARDEGSDEADTTPNWVRPTIIAVSLGLSVILFTLLFKATTVLLGVPQSVWSLLSGVIVALLGLNFLFPSLWLRLAAKFHIETSANKLMAKSSKTKGFGGDILTGFALGPVFNSCSPTYLLIVATVLPASFGKGLLYLIAYAVGLSGTLLMVSFFGQSAVKKLGLVSKSRKLQKFVGIIFLLVGLLVVFGIDKKVQTYVLDKGWYDPISRLEQSLE